MEINPAFAAPCGLYCGVCAIHLADRDGNAKLKEKLANLYKGGTAGKGVLPNAENLTAADIHCKGCLSDDLFMHCQQCDIRNCTQAKGIEGCHECGDFPCNFITDFPMSVGKKAILRSAAHRRLVGTEQWIMDEEARYHCPQCGAKAFRGAMRCNQCKAELNLD